MSGFREVMARAYDTVRSGRFGEGRRHAEQAFAAAGSEAERAEALMQSGYAACGLKEHPAARTFWQKVLDAFSVPPEQKSNAQLCIGLCYDHEDKRAESRAAYEGVVLMPGGPPADKANALIAMGNGCWCDGKHQEARDIFARAMAVDGAPVRCRADAQLATARCFESEAAERYGKEIREACGKVLAMEGAHPFHASAARCVLAQSLRRDGSLDKALAEFRKVLELELGHPHDKSDALLQIGAIYEECLNLEAARAEFEKLARMRGAKEEHRRLAKERLARLDRPE